MEICLVQLGRSAAPCRHRRYIGLYLAVFAYTVAGVSIGNETATASNYNEPEPEPTTTAPLHVNNQQLVRAEQHNNENHSTENDNNENSTRILESEGSLVTQEIWGGGEASDNTTTTGTEIQSSTSGIVYTPGGTMQINGTQYIVVDKSEEITLSRTKRRKSKIRNSRKRVYSHEYYIKRMLLRDQDYDKTTRPVKNDSATTTVYVGMSLYHILDTNEKYQTLSALIAVRLRWIDDFLRWDPARYGGVDHVWVPAMDIWRPDIFINNFADDSFQDFMNTFAIVSHDGSVLWMFPAVVKTYCTLDVRHFPFDRQKCNIIFISWTFNGFKLNVTYNVSEHNTVYYTPKNQEWYVDEIGVARDEKIYACCLEPYPDVTFSIHMTRRSLFYIINLIFPCLLIYAVSFLGFFLPVESGEKVNLEITILLALVVFLLIVGETLPPTPDAIPALGVLFGTTMLMVSIALVMAVIVTNIFLRKDSGHRVPVCLRKIFIGKSRRSSFSNKVTHTENHILESKIQEIEIDNLSNHSEAETLTCRSRCSRKRSGTPFKVDLDLHVRISHEWQVLAKCVDRMFFWLFLAASVAALTSMFLQVPAYNAT